MVLEATLGEIAFNFFGTRSLTKAAELHGKDLFHGKGVAKGRKIEDRIRVFEDIATFIVDNKIPVRMVCIDIDGHKQKYKFPMAPYRLGLMLILERFAEYLEPPINDIGLVFGDYEADEVTGAVVDFSEYKTQGKTPMYYGRTLGRLLDTVYFTQSHHSRFLQLADLLVYMAGRFDGRVINSGKWHDQKVKAAWDKIKASGTVLVQHWP